jgi:23S rRNA pseudouridine1911/1915/1917 synthase
LRVDVWLEQRLEGLSRARIQALIRQGHITLDGASVKPHRKVREGQVAQVSVPPLEPAPVAPEPLPLCVLFEDADIIVVDKAAGMVVHPAVGHSSGTLVNALLHHCGDLTGVGGERRPGIVHRLDRDTSGVLVAAKNEAALHALQAQFRGGRVLKEYLALVRGRPRLPNGRIETLIGRSRQDRKKMSTRPATRGRKAVTCYRVEEEFGAAALLRVQILTGRTHQIRVHMAHLGCPVLGDRQYGRPRGSHLAPRQMLHAETLALDHPRTGRRLTFRAALPADFREVLDGLRRGREAGHAAR